MAGSGVGGGSVCISHNAVEATLWMNYARSLVSVRFAVASGAGGGGSEGSALLLGGPGIHRQLWAEVSRVMTLSRTNRPLPEFQHTSRWRGREGAAVRRSPWGVFRSNPTSDTFRFSSHERKRNKKRVVTVSSTGTCTVEQNTPGLGVRYSKQRAASS